MTIDLSKLFNPFPPDMVEWRIGSTSKDKTKGMALAYIDARSVMERLDEVCGVSNWQCRYTHADSSSIAYSDTKEDRFGNPVVVSKTLGKTICEIGIKIDNEWCWKADGAGDTDFEAEKGALSDAFKRAAVRWGVGRYLYDLPATWVKIDEFKKIIPSELERLMSFLPNAQKGVTVTGLQGLSKTPAKFWEKNKLIEPFLSDEVVEFNKNGKYSEDTLRRWYLEVKRKIDKAPTREHLARYQADNQHIMDLLPSSGTEALREAFEIRASQFDGI